MTLFWLLCLSLALFGLAFRHHLRGALGNLWLHLFGVRVRAPRPQTRPGAVRPAAPLRHDFWPPPRVDTRAGP